MIKTEITQAGPGWVAFGSLEVGTFFMDEDFRSDTVFVKLDDNGSFSSNGAALEEGGLDMGYSWMPDELVRPIRRARFIVEEY